MKRIAIIGGGISGLSAAYQLEKARAAGAPIEYTLFESSHRLGGSISSERVEGCLVEAGPDSFLTEKPWAAMLCKELGIADQIIGSNDARAQDLHCGTWQAGCHARRADVHGAHQAGAHRACRRCSPGAQRSAWRASCLHPPRPMHGDETVASWWSGISGLRWWIALPIRCSPGVYGGDANKLSARAVLPRFVEMEEKYGSLSRAMLAAHKKMAATAKSQPRTARCSARSKTACSRWWTLS